MPARASATPLRLLAPGSVDIWLSATKSAAPDRLVTWLELMSEDERRRYDRYFAPKAQLQHLVARVLVRTVLCRYADVNPCEWRFDTNAYGRPSITTPVTGRDLRFNLSHTDGLVALAVAEGSDVGVDVETIDRDVDISALAPMVLASTELHALGRAASEAKRELFFVFWTLKEAYIKARGMGLSLPLGGFAFDLSGAVPRISFDLRLVDDDAGRWLFRRFAPTPRHAMAIAAEGTRLNINLHWIALDGTKD